MNPQQPDPRLPSPRRLIQLLEEAGWRQVSGRGDQYLRLAPQGQELDPRRQSLLVPLNPEAPDFPELMREAVDALQRLPGDSTASTLLSRLTTSPTDQFAFAKETSAPRGWIQWDQGHAVESRYALTVDMWTTSDVARALGVSESTVRAYHSRGEMPPADGRLGRTPWWREATVREWMHKRSPRTR